MSTYETWFFYRQIIPEEGNCSGEEIIPTFTCNVYINSCEIPPIHQNPKYSRKAKTSVRSKKTCMKNIKVCFLIL